MKSFSRVLLAAIVAAAALTFCGTAVAGIITVGPSLTTGNWVSKGCESASCALLNYNYGENGGIGHWLDDPFSGVIVRLNVVGGTTPGEYRIRTVSEIVPLGGAPFRENLFHGSSELVPAVPSTGVQTYSTSMPVSGGKGIALSMSEGASIGFLEGAGRSFAWSPDPAEGAQLPDPAGDPRVVGFNVEIQPPPEIDQIGPTWGLTTGGTAVAIEGENLEGASAVTFGSAAATSFTVESETRIAAIAPPGSPGSVPISVTTVAGTATTPSWQAFTYDAPPPVLHCVVPRLRGKTMKAVRRVLGNAECELRGVKRLDGATAKTGRVSKQSVAPGTTLRFGAEITVTLEPPHAKASGKKK